MKRFLFLLTVIFISLFCGIAASAEFFLTDEGIIYGGYCYYVENENIYRAPISMLTGETELFREGSQGIDISGSTLISKGLDGKTYTYSLTCELPIENFSERVSGSNELLLGSLSAKYESNGNPGAISSGNDAGGVSFGAYQFASKAGVPKAFASWCISSGSSPLIGQRLLDAYEADLNSCGENFKLEWRRISEEDSELFLAVQHNYVKEKYYDAIVSRVENSIQNFDIDLYGIALKNVFWSRSVQHGVGGSYNVITRAFDAIGGYNFQSEEVLIRAIYAESGALSDTGTYPMTGSAAEKLGIAGKYMKYYSRNSSAVQVSVYKRLNINELGQALDMLNQYGGYNGESYKVRYFDCNSKIIYECQVKHGEDSIFKGEIPTKNENIQYRFAFFGWDKSEKNITSDVDIYPIFTAHDKLWNGEIAASIINGSGTQTDPYRISTHEELAFISDYVVRGGKTKDMYFVLADDIILGFGEKRQNFQPIGTEENPFSGHFDGCGFAIDGLTVDCDTAGLFGYTENAFISNIIIKNALIKGNTAGILIGKTDAYVNCFIRNCSVNGLVYGNEYAGGIIGYACGNGLWISNIMTSGKVNAPISGGIIGYFDATTLSNSVSYTDVNGEAFGNIVAKKTKDNLILNCFYSKSANGNDYGIPIKSEDAGNELSYPGLDFDSDWTTVNGKTELTMLTNNKSNYYMYGDVDCNGLLDTRDSILLAQYLAKWNIIYSDMITVLGDVNCDGVVNSLDSVIFAQYLAKWNVSLGKK